MSSKLMKAADAVSVQPVEWGLVSEQAPPAAGTTLGFAMPAQQHAAANQEAAQVLLTQQRRIQELEHEVERRARESFQQGQAAGLSAGTERAQQKLEPVIARLAKTVEELSGMRRRVRSEAEEDAVRLAIAVARKVLHREITVDSESLLGLVKAAMQRVDARELHRVRMHPEEIPILERHLQAGGMPVRIEVVADPSLERGGVVFETTRGILDASVGTQLAEIERGFIDIVKRTRDAL